MKRIFSLAIILTFLLITGGCIKMGPDFQKPDTGVQFRKSYQHIPTDGVSKKISDRWWTLFNDPDLDRMVDNVIANNLDIKKSMAAISELRSYFVQSRSDRYPTLSIQGEAKRQRISPGLETDAYSLSLPASFEIDLWGRLARAEEVALANLMAAENNARTVAQTIVAEAVTLYLQIESLERRIQITQQSIENYRRNLSLVQRRYEGGIASILDLRQARRILAQAEASLPELRQDLGTNQQKLAVLLGRYPETQPCRCQPEDYFKRLDPVPPGLPAELLQRRPDIRAAEANLRALNAKIGVAKASRFPRISLTGNFGYSSTELNELFRARNELWNIAFGALQPLFDARKLKAGQRAAEAQYQQGLAEYAKTILTAFSEVENALLTREEQMKRRDRILNFLTEARATEQVAQSRYERGLDNYLTVLDAQRTRFEAEENLVLVDLAILSNRVTLHRALGGGWADPLAQTP